ncbi:MAG: transglutaminase domain-containing protein [Clostridia bacterium]|nr:transglutaminase domain-containing protein [Clostridia bacterium]
MLYDNYRKKILQRAAFLRQLLRFVPVIIAGLVVIFSAVTALLLAKGTLTGVSFTNHAEYGSAHEYKANAFLSKAYFEYSPRGQEQWSAETPKNPGEYDVRVVSGGIFGKKYKYIDVLSIYPRRIAVTAEGGEVPYGTTPVATADLGAGDRIVCDKFVYESLVLKETKVKADYASVKIYNSEGEDVSYAYEIDTPYSDVTITPRELLIYVTDASHEYDGKEFSYNIYELAEGALAEGDTLQARFEKTLTDVGTVKNTPVVSIVNKDGADVTHFYSINESAVGNLTVTKRPLHIITGSAVYEYNGEFHQCLEYSVSNNTKLLPGHEIIVNGAISLDNAGTVNNSMSFSVQDENGKDVTSNYSVVVEEGTLTVNKKPVTVTTGSSTWVYDGTAHSNTEYVAEGVVFGNIAYNSSDVTYIDNCGTAENRLHLSIFSGTSDITSNYDITYNYGTLEVTKRPITIQTASGSWLYDGDQHSPTTDINDDYVILEGSLANGQTISFSPINEQGLLIKLIDVGAVPNRSVAYIYASDTVDVTENYNISYAYGTLSVYPRPITVKPAAAFKTYDGTPLYATDIEFAKGSMTLAKDTHILEYKINGSRTNVYDTDVSSLSDVKVTYGGEDITNNYDITCLEGELTVVPRIISVASGSAEKLYDGTPLTNSEIFLAESSYDMLVDGHEIVGTPYGSQTEVGESENIFDIGDVRILGSGEDVTANYSISSESYGTLRVYYAARIHVTAYSDHKVYDGTPLTCDEYNVSVTYGELREGHTVSASVSGSQTEIGRSENVVSSVTVTDADGNDVTYMYEITTESGTLTVYEPMDTETVFMNITSDKGGLVYLKMNSYGDYNLRGWNKAENYTGLIGGKYNASYFTPIALKNAGYTQYNAYISDAQIYMLPYYSGVGGSYGVPSNDNNVAGTYTDTDYTVPYFVLDSYENKLEHLKGYLGAYADEELAYRSFVHSNYLRMDGETYAFMQSIIESEGFDINSSTIITDVASYIQNAATYNLYYDQALDNESNVAIAFLRDYKEGKCVHYATAATLLYRALGIPARYVEGFMVYTEVNKVTEVKNPGHAWVEIYIDGVGWIQVEVTGGDDSGGGSGSGSGSGSGGIGGEDESNALHIMPSYQHKTYDGTPLYASNEIVINSMLTKLIEEGYSYRVNVSGYITEVGTGKSTVESFTLYDENGRDVTSEFEIVFRDGTLEILPDEIKVISVYLYETKKVYDGTPVTIGDYDYEIIEGGDGVTLDIDFIAKITEAGNISLSRLNSDIDYYIDYKVYEDGKDVTAFYRIEFGVFDDMDESTYTPIEITPRKITLTAASATKVYDGKELTNTDVAITFGTLASGEKLEAYAGGSITEVGTTNNFVAEWKVLDADGADVTDNYEFLLIDGELTVLGNE